MKKMYLQFPKELSNQARNAFLIIAAYLVASVIASILLVIQLIKAPFWQLWTAGLAVFTVVLASGIALRLVRRGRVEAGIWLTTGTAILTSIVITTTFSGLGIILFLSAVLLNSLVAIQTLKSRQATYHAITGFAAGILILLIDRFTPTHRINISGLQILVYVLAGIMLLLFGYFISRQFRRYAIGTKFLLSILLTTAIAVMTFSLFIYSRTQRSEAFLTNELETTVRQLSEQQLNDTAQFEALIAEQTLSTVAKEVKKLADHQASLFNQQSILGQGTYWDAHTKVFELSDGQHGNSANDVASVFVPNHVMLTDELISNLNTGAYLDFIAPGVLEANPDLVSVYFNDASNFSIYYPNINLATNVPPDFDLLAQSFYAMATPEANPQREVVWTPLYHDPAGNGMILTSSAPVYDRNNRFRGVVSADVQISRIAEQIAAIKVGQTGFAFLTASTGNIIAMPDAGYTFFDLPVEDVQVGESPRNTVIGHGSVSMQAITRQMLENESGLAIVTHRDFVLLKNTDYYFAYATMPSVGYRIGLIVPVAELDAPILIARDRIAGETQTSTQWAVILLVVIYASTAGAGFFLSRFISRPLVELTRVAENISAGNLNEQAQIETEDETGRLATAFNKMTGQLRELIGSLEQRVADRTRNLELAAEVGRSVSQVRDLEIMLQEAAESIRSRFDLYYTQVYLTNPSQSELSLYAGTGSVGNELLSRGHRLQINTASINGRAATEKQSVIIADTIASRSFRPNPLLPDTRSEMAIPLLVGENVVGVLDLQSQIPGALSQEMLPAFETVAGQLAIAIQNAKLVADANEARAEMEKQAQRVVRTNWNNYLDAIYRPEQTGFMFEHNQILPLMQESPIADPNAVSASIALAGEELGSLVVELDEEHRTDQNVELVNTIARQVAQQIESLRLLQSAEQYRHEAEETARRNTAEGWQQYIKSRPIGSLGYIYDRREVRPLEHEPELSAFTLPIKAREQEIGKLSILGMDEKDSASIEIVNIVLERLGTHIEGLRLSEQIKNRARREQTLRRITTALRGSTNPETILRIAVRELGSILGRKTIVQVMPNEQGDQMQSAGDNGMGLEPTIDVPESA